MFNFYTELIFKFLSTVESGEIMSHQYDCTIPFLHFQISKIYLQLHVYFQSVKTYVNILFLGCVAIS